MIIYNSSFLLRLNVCNDLAKAMKALDGKTPRIIAIIQCMQCWARVRYDIRDIVSTHPESG